MRGSLFVEAHALQVARFHLLDEVARQLGVFREQPLVGLFVVQIGQQLLAFEQDAQTLGALVGQNADFVEQVALQPLDLRFFDRLRPLVLLLPLAREDFAIDNGAFDSGRAVERRILHVAGLFAENRAQQFLFRSELGFALGRHFAHQNVARLHRGADADDAAFIQIAQEGIRDIRNIARDFLRPQLGVAGLDFELLDMDRGVVVFLDQLFADQDGVFEVVTAPRHERHQDVSPQRQFAHIGARTVGQNLSLDHALALRAQSASD